MRRDIDLIRKILLEVEKQDTISDSFDLLLKGYTKREVAYHVKLLNQAGYLEAKDDSTRESPDDWRPICLTWPGHEFLDAARDNTVWSKVKATIGEKLPSVSFDIFKLILTLTVKQQFGLEV